MTRSGVELMQIQRGDSRECLCGDGTALDLDCGGGHTNLYMGENCTELYTCASEY